VGRPPTRRLTWLDAAILLGFAGLAAAAVYRIDREWAGGDEPVFAHYDPRKGTPAWFQALVTPYMQVHFDFLSALGVMTLGVAVVAFRHPIVLRRGRLGPGLVAAAVAALFEVALLAKEVARMWPVLGWPPSFSAVDWSKWLWVNMASSVSGAVLGAWTALALAGRWRTSPDWRDRLGRVVGWCWVGDVALSVVSRVFWP
jgi:hypothetical protein